MSKFDCLQAFIQVVELKSFAAAAKKLNISTAAVSRQVAKLEADLKTLLIHRTTRHIALTEVGTTYYQQAKLALKGLLEAEVAITESQQEPVGELSVLVPPYFADNYLLPKLPAFLARYPNIRLSLALAERFPDMIKENIDLIFGVSINKPDNLVRRRVASTRYVICASPAYLKQYGCPVTPTDLKAHRYITHIMREPDNVVTFKQDLKVYVEPILALNDSRAMLKCAEMGLGIVKLHHYMVAAALESGQLQEILNAYVEPEQAIYLYYSANRYLQTKIRHFIDFFIA